jgi:hypothetical protein
MRYFLLFCLVSMAKVEATKMKQLQILQKSNSWFRKDSIAGKDSFILLKETQQWDPAKTAIIICDMWDQHWCKGATERVNELAPHMNNVLSIAREKGILIVHSPSDCMKFYKDYPQRKIAENMLCLLIRLERVEHCCHRERCCMANRSVEWRL